ncbi:MAG TPA: acetate--CoA ligase family protein [Actinomycetota bacterium]|nr:acetate--CoA ligase family protein [Actinomycetota bacterium]
MNPPAVRSEAVAPARPLPRSPLAAMLEARSVAVVGASSREGSFGLEMMRQLVGGGFDGDVFPVNPSYSEVMGTACLASLGDLPGPVDLAILGVANHRVEEQLVAAASAGVRAAVIFASTYEEPREGVDPLPERLARIAREAGMAICGSNGMGFLNVERRLRACGFSEPAELEPGGICFVTHSGSVFSAVLHNDRGLRFNLVVSSGLELTTTASDYVRYALGLESTRVIGLFLEAARDPSEFVQALRLAASRDVPVVALKVGREPAARSLVAAHSGALAGDDAAYEAVFDACGVLRVGTLDELADTLELLQPGRRAASGGLAAIHDSGGERAHLIDVAAEVGVAFASLDDGTLRRLSAILEPGLAAGNPLDAWGTGNDAERIYADCMRAMLDDPNTAALAMVVDLTTQEPRDGGYVAVAREIAAGAHKPVAVLSNLHAAIDPVDARAIRSSGIPILEGTATGLAAFGHLFGWRDFRGRAAPEPTPQRPSGVRDRWLHRLEEPHGLDEVESLELLADYGVPVAAARHAASADEALEAAKAIGFPVAMKTAEHAHKTALGGVRLGVADEDAVRRAYEELRNLGERVTVAAMAPAGVEVAIGVVRDPQFGPLVMVAAGGVLIELLRDRRFVLPPVDRAAAMRAIDRLAVRPLLDGSPGVPPADLDALAGAMVGLSALAEDVGDRLDALDVNPVLCGPDGVLAVDALVVRRGA